MSEKMFNPQGTPEQIFKAERENLTDEQKELSQKRKEFLTDREKMLFKTATEAIIASRETGFIRMCEDTPENRTLLENEADRIVYDNQYLFNVNHDEDGYLPDNAWHVEIDAEKRDK